MTVIKSISRTFVFFLVANVSAYAASHHVLDETAFAQNDSDPITYGFYRKVESKAMGEERTVLVSLPIDYETSDRKYPVLIQLDGDRELFLERASTVWYLTDMAQKITGCIVVGVPNTDRGRDFGRESDRFYRFLTEELIPFIDRNYRTNDVKILCGQSAGSIFAFQAFLLNPDVFNAVFLISFGCSSRSMDFYRNEIVNSQKLKEMQDVCIFITNAKNDPYDPSGERTRNGKEIVELLKKTASKTNRITYREYENEGHVPFPSFYEGLRFLFEGGGND